MTATRFNSTNTQKGMSLVEIMVGLVIGLIGMLVIFQTVSSWGRRTATTTSGGDAQTSGAIGMYYLERDIKQAGWGFGMAPGVNPANMGCMVSVSATRTFRFAPAEIVQGASGAPDTIRILYGNSASFTATSDFLTPNPATPTVIASNQQPGFVVGDRAILANGTNCALVTVTASAALALTMTYVLASGTPVVSGKLYNLGPQPIRAEWQINAGRALVWAETILNSPAAEVADGVIDLQAEYGIDGDNNNRITDGSGGSPNEWQTADPTNWTTVRAIRVAILVRSKQFDPTYTAPNPTCGWCPDTTLPSPSPPGFLMTNVDGNPANAIAGDPNNWVHYRYEVFEKVIPLRNMIWGASP